MKYLLKPIIFFLLFVMYASVQVQARKGITAGLEASVISSGTKEDVRQYEAGFALGLPWGCQLSEKIFLNTVIRAEAGRLKIGDKDTFIMSAGPGAGLDIGKRRLLLECGFKPTYLADHSFGKVKLGGPLQFAVYAQAQLRIFESIVAGIRSQHISNADIYRDNHGFNTYMILINCSLPDFFSG